MFSWLRRKLILLLLLLFLASRLHAANPQWLSTLGRWITGEGKDRFSVAVSRMMENIGLGQNGDQIVEVFGDEMQD